MESAKKTVFGHDAVGYFLSYLRERRGRHPVPCETLGAAMEEWIIDGDGVAPLIESYERFLQVAVYMLLDPVHGLPSGQWSDVIPTPICPGFEDWLWEFRREHFEETLFRALHPDA